MTYIRYIHEYKEQLGRKKYIKFLVTLKLVEKNIFIKEGIGK